MADNLVRLVVGANDADATAHLEALKRRLDEIGRKVETASVNVKGDKESELALARIAQKLDSVGRKTERPNIKIDGIARASVELMAVSLQLDRLGEKTSKANIVTRAMGGAVNGLIGMLTTAIPLIGTSATTLGVLAVAAGAVLAALMPLIANLGLVAVGFAGFAAGAVGEIQKVITAHQKLMAAQQAYEKATTKAGRHSALKAEREAVEGLSGSEKHLMGLMTGLQREFEKLERAVRPEVVRAFAAGIRVLKDLMPTIIPLAQAAGRAIGRFLRNIDDWIRSPSGQKFIHWMQSEGPKAIAAFGRALFTGMRWLGQFASFMFNTGETMRRNWFRYMHDISNVLDVLRETFINVGHAIEAAWNSTVHQVSALIDTLREAFVGAGHTIESIWNAVAGAAQSAAGIIVGAVHTITGALGSINNALGGIPGKVLGALGLASGGIAGAAAGGLHSGFRVVGERGRELVQLPAGSRVFNNAQTEQMLAGAGGGGRIVLELVSDGSDEMEYLRKRLAKHIRVRYGGSVTAALGS